MTGKMIFQTTGDRQVSAALALLRTVAGVVFLAHGAQKLFVFGAAGVGAGFAQMGVPFPTFIGPAVGLLEFLGGAALIAGLLTRPVGALLAGVMAGAVVLVHFPAGFFMPAGYEFVLTLLAVAAALSISGAGRYSVDAWIGHRYATSGHADSRASAAAPSVAGPRRAA